MNLSKLLNSRDFLHNYLQIGTIEFTAGLLEFCPYQPCMYTDFMISKDKKWIISGVAISIERIVFRISAQLNAMNKFDGGMDA